MTTNSRQPGERESMSKHLPAFVPPDAADVERNKSVEPFGERLRAELTDWLERNGIVSLFLDTTHHRVQIDIDTLPPEIKSVLKLWGSIYVTRSIADAPPAIRGTGQAQRERIQSAVMNFCGHDGELDAGGNCPACENIVDAVMLAAPAAVPPARHCTYCDGDHDEMDCMNRCQPASAPPAKVDEPGPQYRRVEHSIVPADGEDWPPILRDNRCSTEFLDKIVAALNAFVYRLHD